MAQRNNIILLSLVPSWDLLKRRKWIWPALVFCCMPSSKLYTSEREQWNNRVLMFFFKLLIKLCSPEPTAHWVLDLWCDHKPQCGILHQVINNSLCSESSFILVAATWPPLPEKGWESVLLRNHKLPPPQVVRSGVRSPPGGGPWADHEDGGSGGLCPAPDALLLAGAVSP